MFLKVPFKHIQNSVVIENEVLQMLWNTKIHMIKRERSKISENLRSLRIWDLTFNLLSWLLWAKQWIELTNSIFKLPWLYNTLVNLGKKDHQKRSAVTLGKVWRSPFLPQQGLQWRTWKQLTARGSDMLPHLALPVSAAIWGTLADSQPREQRSVILSELCPNSWHTFMSIIHLLWF
jgi:hypothetical protein